MKELINYIKTALLGSPNLTYVKKIEVVGKDYIPPVMNSQTPWIGIAPVSSPERWITNAKKEVIHSVDIYIMNYFQVIESAVIGDSAGNRGMLDVVNDVWTELRGKNFSDYLDKPCDLELTNYAYGSYEDKYYACMATFTLGGHRIFESGHVNTVSSFTLDRTENVLRAIKERIQTLSNIKKVQITLPRLLPPLMDTDVPYVGIAPSLTPESWKEMRKEAVDQIELYVVTEMQLRESAIMGGSGLDGSLDILADITDLLRGETFNNQLERPLDMSATDYEAPQMSEGYYVFVPSVQLTCKRLFNV